MRSGSRHADPRVDLVLPDAVGSASCAQSRTINTGSRRDGSIVYIDIEAACVGLIECDLVYL